MSIAAQIEVLKQLIDSGLISQEDAMEILCGDMTYSDIELSKTNLYKLLKRSE